MQHIRPVRLRRHGRVESLDTVGNALDQYTATATRTIRTFFIERRKEPELSKEPIRGNRDSANYLLVEPFDTSTYLICATIDSIFAVLITAGRALP
jgi:hypothetical protein